MVMPLSSLRACLQSMVAAVFLVSLVLLQGCTTQQYHDWYEGKAATGVVLKSYKTVLVEAINGRDAGASFIGQEHSYELAPGKYTLVVTFADMFELSADEFEKVESGPIKMTFMAEAGKTYQLSHQPLADLAAAKAFAKKPELVITDMDAGVPVVATLEYTVPKRLLPALRFASEEQKVFASDYQAVPTTQTAEIGMAQDDDLSALKMLQFSWDKASTSEREAFLKWIGQP